MNFYKGASLHPLFPQLFLCFVMLACPHKKACTYRMRKIKSHYLSWIFLQIKYSVFFTVTKKAFHQFTNLFLMKKNDYFTSDP